MLRRALRIVALGEVQDRALLLVGLDVLVERLKGLGDAVENRNLSLAQQPVGAAADRPRLVVDRDRVDVLARGLIAVAEADQRLDRPLRVRTFGRPEELDRA